jgi:hypothetical protein
MHRRVQTNNIYINEKNWMNANPELVQGYVLPLPLTISSTTSVIEISASSVQGRPTICTQTAWPFQRSGLSSTHLSAIDAVLGNS